MTDISMQGATLTITGAGGVNSVTFKDLSDEGTPIGFGDAAPIRTSKTLNGRMLAWHAQTTLEFTLGVIPNSKSDRVLRALLLSSIVHPTGQVSELSFVQLKNAVFTIPGHDASSSMAFTFTDGFLVGGLSAIGTTNEGRMTTGPYRFQWEDVSAPVEGSVRLGS